MRAHEFITELTFYGSQCTDKCQGHRAGYQWARSKRAKVPPNSSSPSFNKGANIAMQHMQQGRNPIGASGIRGQGGRFQKFSPEKTD